MTGPHDDRAFLTGLFEAAVDAADPFRVLARHLPKPPKGRTVVIGAGKGSAQMAKALEEVWDGPLSGLVVTRYGFGAPCASIEIVEAAHPVPDESGLAGAERLLQTVSGLTADDLVIALISGGGSALLPAPPEGLTLADEIGINQALLRSGAPISAMNAIRKQFSRIKGGRLAAAAAPARVATLIVSDIPGDVASLVASGPTIPDGLSRTDAINAVEEFGISLPPAALDFLRSGKETAPQPNDPRFAANSQAIIASSAISLEAAAVKAQRVGMEAVILSDAIEGEAREAGRFHAALAREVATKDRPFRKPVVILSGGETSVTIAGGGKGGRNTEFLLSFARVVDGLEGISALAADTDGIDGSEDNAGAFADGGTASRMRTRGLDPVRLLLDNDAWSAFNGIGDLFVPGPTGTNVNDFRAILVR
ncbi:glycerate kinase type-2 family protein [Rhodobium gokarnense]|uniref:Hydroxypyruvate reductase n=1 Tax=Rhodobium gokarnense TaxID=364296 RepID=A0ABT3HC51_9HYPH|nr:glycerate kinase [Rhodobium gokarnense]MCW2307970.1 hydroxypyruvate reductase [Rhodobium gokarnense]